jgi:hypothetical protein
MLTYFQIHQKLISYISYFLDKKQRVSLQRDNMNFKSKDYGDCFCNIIIFEDISIVYFTLINEIYYSFLISHYCKKFR